MSQHAPHYPRHPSSHADLRAVARRVMLARGLEPDFSDAALAELKALHDAAVANDPAIKDLRDLLWCSIDNDDSLDLDQLSVSASLPGGAVKIFVAVADVDALVERGSAIDDHAQANTTSVYTAAQIFPMLPTRLSTDLTSLNGGVDRLALVVEMVVADGAITTSDVYRATVRNKAKLAYNGVAAWLDGTAPAPAPVTAVAGMDAQLRAQDQVAAAMKKRRFEKGALTLETLEARAVFEDGVLADLVPEGRNRAKDLIEDFMIGANGVVARFLADKGFPSLRRVLRSPERWAKIVALADAHGGPALPEAPDNAALEAFLIAQRDKEPAKFADLSLSVIKLLGRGEYVLDLPGKEVEGHFGLALRDYTHSTAPNRRFPDLVSQRLVKAALAGRRPAYSNEELGALASHCTQQEDAATKVERQVRKSAAALLLSTHVGQRFDAIVTGASSKGTWVRVSHPAAEGMLVRGAHGLDVGDRVPVVLVATDFEHGYIDFARA